MIQTLSFPTTVPLMRRWDLIFGRVPRLPVDIMFGSAIGNDDVQTYDEYVENLQKDIREAMRIPQGNTREPREGKQRSTTRNPEPCVALEVGDYVLLVNKKEKGEKKVADVWDSVVHVVTWKDPTLHIYRAEDPTTKKSKVVHRNFLLPVNFLPLEGQKLSPQCSPQPQKKK